MTDYPATISTFKLDAYEATVGRFREFVAAYPDARPKPGDGANPNDPEDTGWDAAWDEELPATQGALLTELAACGLSTQGQTWTRQAAGNESRPMNCITWHVAAAFCAWDGGRLPTQAEWNYAAAGGDEQRPYPWGDAAPEEDLALAVFDSIYEDQESWCSSSSVNLKPPYCKVSEVGMPVAGAGRWGQLDLAGNVEEWVLDSDGNYEVPCVDCARPAPSGYGRARGGNYGSPASKLLISDYSMVLAGLQAADTGVRCARAAE